MAVQESSQVKQQLLEKGWDRGWTDRLQVGNFYIPRMIEDIIADSFKPRGKICILSIDGGGMRGIIPARILAHLEQSLQRKSNNPKARIADYFDVAAGTNSGGITATLLLTPDENGLPLFQPQQICDLFAKKGNPIFKSSLLSRLIKSQQPTKQIERFLKQILIRDTQELTLRDTLKPLLIPCYDLSSSGAFLFSRAGAMEAEEWNFPLWQICRATTASPLWFRPAQVRSVDGKTVCTAVDGGLVMNNPTASAITHVLHNKKEFPTVGGAKDLLVLSLGTGQFDQSLQYEKVRRWRPDQWAKPMMNVVADGISDMVDHTVSLAFSDCHQNYLRLQPSGGAALGMDDPSPSNVKRFLKMADDLLEQKSLEYSPFGGKIELTQTNAERLDWFADQLIQEQKSRALRTSPTAILKQAALAPSKPLP
ncbi:hypothetical protein O6H91_07G013400 [Diphasiastrum complanatum]|uniref:Uncharacterized protein n=2 Tax=Diphasiastrum complanatum TaxID=34168 RepID=A0ACC2D2H1_DIPCM|nr:hypothetical protein O6H91_07G013400 [Diphasiastrum complanatum]KAJ7548464.1 hypothetical protein O6H91_07G013400 [Diphasiastrum complanatum]